jgi:hypothetical protein
MLPLHEFCIFGFFAHLIHYIIAWYAQILWTPTYHITVPAARRVHPLKCGQCGVQKVIRFPTNNWNLQKKYILVIYYINK